MDARLARSDSATGPRLIELFALSGAGKSTVVRAVADRAMVATRKDLAADWSACPLRERLRIIARALSNAGRMRAAVRLGAVARTRDSRLRLLRLVVKTEWLRSKSGVVLLDQGLLQEIWSILLSSGQTRCDPARVAALVRALYTGIDATIVVLDVAPTAAAARMSGRAQGNSRFDNLPETERGRALQQADRLFQAVVGAVRAAGIAVVTIDGTAPIATVEDGLHKLLATAPRRSVDTTGVRRPRRISVVGATGSGKSYLAAQLAERLRLPLCALDQLRREGAADGASFPDRVAGIVAQDDWIIDGHYRDVRHLIWQRADLVVWLNYPLHLVARRLLKRFRGKREARVEGAAGAGETASWARRGARLLRTVRERKTYGRLLRSDAYRGVHVVELRSVRATLQWLRGL